MPSDREQALSALTAWHRERAWARVDPQKLEITSVERTGPLQVVLRSVFESRGIRYSLAPAQRRTLENVAGPDPWTTPLHQPMDAAIGNEITESLDELVPMDCSICSASGVMRCLTCDGMGRIQHGRHSHVCDTCGGRGELRCDTCRGSGGLVGQPTAWSRIDVHEEMRTTGTDALPLEVALDLGETATAGDVVHRLEAERITDARGLGGYREGASVPAEIAEAVRSLVAGSGVPEKTKLRRQTLEVRRAPVFEVRLASGATFHVWGTPPKAWPVAPVSTVLGRLLPFLAR